jgi:hypothetical protein
VEVESSADTKCSVLLKLFQCQVPWSVCQYKTFLSTILKPIVPHSTGKLRAKKIYVSLIGGVHVVEFLLFITAATVK